MPVKVFIKGIGNVKFPDGMTDDAIEQAVREGLRKGEIEEAAGLPMDQASKEARRKLLGFSDEVVYHGTAGDVKSFKPSGSVTKSRSAKNAVWFTDDPEVAGGYARLAGEDKPVQDLIDASYAAERRGDWDAAHDLMAQAEKLEQSGELVDAGGQNIIAARIRDKNLKEIDADGATMSDLDESQLATWVDEAKEEGYDGLKIRNFSDNADWGNYNPATHYAIFDPKDIRGINAKFDPRNIDSDDILAGLKGAAPLAGAAALAGGSEEAEASFAGKLARTADTMMLDVAQKMERAKVPRDEIWQKTGWFKGPDGEWRFEVDDSGATYQSLRRTPESENRINQIRAEQDQIRSEITQFHNRHGVDFSKGASQLLELPDESFEELQRLHRALRSLQKQEKAVRVNTGVPKTAGEAYQNPALYQAYPDLQDVGFNANPDGLYMGQYSPRNDEISINTFYGGDSQRSTMAHELQHAIQSREGFARGSNPDLAAKQLSTAEMSAKSLKGSVDTFNEHYQQLLDRQGYGDALELSNTAWRLKEIDRLKGYRDQSDRLTNKRRLIFNSGGSIIDPNIEHRIRMGINWPKRHRPQWERDAAFVDYINQVVDEAEASLDPKRVEQVRNAGVADPHAKFQRQAARIRKEAEQTPLYQRLQKDSARVRELNEFLDRYEGQLPSDRPYSLYHDTAGEVEARLVQERLDMTPEQRRATPPWRSEAYQETPEHRQAIVGPYGDVSLPSQRGAATPGMMGGLAAGALSVLPGLQATKETLAGGGAYMEAIARSLAGMVLGGVQTLGDTWSPQPVGPFTRVMNNMNAGVEMMMSGMDISPEQQAGMQRIAETAVEAYQAAPEPLQWAIKKYLEGLEPAAQAAEYIGEHHGYPNVGTEAGNALRTLEFAMP